jgi:hypothetical protein
VKLNTKTKKLGISMLIWGKICFLVSIWSKMKSDNPRISAAIEEVLLKAVRISIKNKLCSRHFIDEVIAHSSSEKATKIHWNVRSSSLNSLFAKEFNIPENIQFDMNAMSLFSEYVDGTKLFFECLDLAEIDNRSEIVNSILTNSIFTEVE